MTRTIARMKPFAANPEEVALLLCGKRNGDGRQTCPGMFGERIAPPPPRAPQVWIYAILRETRPGVFDLVEHAKKQRAEGRPAQLRRHRLRDNDREGRGPEAPARDLGRIGENGGTHVVRGPVTVHCPRCREPNTIPAEWFA